MTCRELAELLLEYEEGSLDPQRSAVVQAHLGCCPPCEHYLATYRLTIRLPRRLPPSPPPARLVQRVEQALQGKAPPAGLPPA